MLRCLRPTLLLFPLLLAQLAPGATSPPPDPADSEPIGPAGNLDKLVITGLTPDLAASLRTALDNQFLLQHEAVPSSPTKPFLDHLTTAATDTLLNAGFANVKATTKRSHDTLLLDITPGTRFKAGPVRVIAPPEVNADLLAKAITTAAPEDFRRSITTADKTLTIALKLSTQFDFVDALWSVDENASFKPTLLKDAQDLITQALLRQGFDTGHVDVTYLRDAATRTAALQVSVTGLGPRMTLAQLDVSRADGNTAQIVRGYLHLVDGQPLNLEILETLFDKLYASARFSKHSLILTSLAPGKAALLIDLEELPGVPRLDQNLSEIDQALLRMRDWSENFSKQPDDLVINYSMPAGSFRAILSPTDEFLIEVKGSLDAAGRGPQIQSLFAQNRTLLQAGPDLRYAAPYRVITTGIFAILEPHIYSLDMSFKTDKSRFDRPLVMRITVTPAGVLSLARAPTSQVTLQDNLLKLTLNNSAFTADAGTGRLLQFEAKEDPLSHISGHISITKGALAAEIKRLNGTPMPNLYERAHPSASALQFMLRAAQPLLFRADSTPRQHQAASALIERLLTPELLATVDQWVSPPANDRALVVPLSREQALQYSSISVLTPVIYPVAKSLYPYGSWPWTITHEALLIHHPSISPAETKRLYEDPALGPLGGLIVAELQNNPTLATLFATQGIERLNPEAFANDLSALIATDAPGPRFVRQFLANLRTLSPAECDTLAATLPPDLVPALKTLHTALQLHKDQPVEQALPAVATDLFPLIKLYLQGRLKFFVPTRPTLPDMVITPP